MKFKCPVCGEIFEGRKERCPYCNAKFHYPNQNITPLVVVKKTPANQKEEPQEEITANGTVVRINKK